MYNEGAFIDKGGSMQHRKWLVVLVSCMLFVLRGTESSSFRARSSLDSQIYQAIWALNIPLVTSMLAQHESLSAQEKEQLLDIARYRATLCDQKRIPLSDKVERAVKSLYSVVGGIMIVRLGRGLNWFTNTVYGLPLVGNWIRSGAGRLKESAANSHVMEANVGAYISDAPVTLTIGGALVILGCLRLFSVLIAVSNDQDARQAEDIVRMISIIPVRN